MLPGRVGWPQIRPSNRVGPWAWRSSVASRPTALTERTDHVNSTRKIALAVGVLFILTFITSIGAVVAYGPVLSDPNNITGAGAETRVFLGAFLELFLIITNIGCAVVLFPLLKRTNEGIDRKSVV